MKKVLHQLTFSKEINLIFLSVYLFAVAMGINFVTFPTILTKHGVSSTQIGVAAMLDMLAGIFLSFFLSKIAARLGLMRTLFIASSLFALTVSLIYFYQNFYLWLTCVFILGSTFFAYIITRQAWLNSLFTHANRSVGLGLFSLVISMGLASGPVIVSMLGAANYASFVASSVLTFFSFLVIASIQSNYQPCIASKHINPKAFFTHNPRCFLAKFFIEFKVYFLLVFTVVFGHEIGLSPEKSGLLISAFLLSGLFDVVVGFLIKKQSPYRLINIGFLGCLTFFTIISLYHDSYAFLLLSYFLFGLFVALIFVSTFTIVNQDYPSEKLVAANATFQAIGSAGALSSALIGGVLMHVFGAYGFSLTIIFGCLFYLIFLVFFEKNNQPST